MGMTKIASLEQLKKLATDSPLDCFIVLGGGMLRSSKSVLYNEGVFSVVNEIDGTEQTLTEEEVMDENFTNIGVAMLKGGFYAY
jgi:hypothetical protein